MEMQPAQSPEAPVESARLRTFAFSFLEMAETTAR